MQFRYTLIDHTSGTAVNTVVPEPIGWDSLTLKLDRDKDYHGFFEYSDDELSGLKFYDDGRQILQTAFTNYGIEAFVELKIEIKCNGIWQSPPLFLGRVDFDRSRFDCGLKGCFAEIATTKSNCLMTLRNRWDQKVDLDSNKDFDGNSLTDYAGLGRQLKIPGKALHFNFSGSNTSSHTYNYDLRQVGQTAPFYGQPYGVSGNYYYNFNLDSIAVNTIPQTSIADLNLGAISYSAAEFYEDSEPILKLEVASKLFCTNKITIRWKVVGEFEENGLGGRKFDCLFRIVKVTQAGVISPIDAISVVSCIGCPDVPIIGDINFNNTYYDVPISPGDKIYMYGAVENYQFTSGTTTVMNAGLHFRIHEHEIEFSTVSKCEETEAEVYLINEALSRTAEAITNDCLRVYSGYFGRPDAQPYANGIDFGDGCGAMEVITNGLKLRNAEMKDGSLPKIQVSFKDLVEGLNAIHNIGYGLEDDPFRANYKMLRVEPFTYFYDNSKTIFTALNVPNLKTSVLADEYISLYKNGYAKWEAEDLGGRNDFMGQREFRTILSTISKTLDKVCKFIASPYSIEATRREQGNNGKDWRYDNDTFIICIKHDDDEVYVVEKQNVYVQHNMDDPDTEYNIRISPARNALRWCRRIAQSLLPNWAGNILKFTTGQGNIVAEGLMNSTFCRLENSTLLLGEGKDIYHIDNTHTVFANEAVVKPIMYNILDEFEYPLSFADYLALIAEPYGMVEYSCNNGPSIFGFIKSITYKPTDGKATFQLIRAYIP